MNLLKRGKVTDLQYTVPKPPALFLDLDNKGLCYVTSLRHFNYHEAELLSERSSVSQSRL